MPVASARAARRHRGIENQLHWTLDAAFRQDDCRVRLGHAAENFAVLRRIALHLLRQGQPVKTGRKAKRLTAGWDEAHLRRLLALSMRLPCRMLVDPYMFDSQGDIMKRERREPPQAPATLCHKSREEPLGERQNG